MSVFGDILVRISRIRTEYGKILRISPYSVRMRENADRNNFECGHFTQWFIYFIYLFELYLMLTTYS